MFTVVIECRVSPTNINSLGLSPVSETAVSAITAASKTQNSRKSGTWGMIKRAVPAFSQLSYPANSVALLCEIPPVLWTLFCSCITSEPSVCLSGPPREKPQNKPLKRLDVFLLYRLVLSSNETSVHSCCFSAENDGPGPFVEHDGVAPLNMKS